MEDTVYTYISGEAAMTTPRRCSNHVRRYVEIYSKSNW